MVSALVHNMQQCFFFILQQVKLNWEKKIIYLCFLLPFTFLAQLKKAN